MSDKDKEIQSLQGRVDMLEELIGKPLATDMDRIQELEDLLSKVTKTEDGVPIFLGMKLWAVTPDFQGEFIVTEGVFLSDGKTVIWGGSVEAYRNECYSSEEAYEKLKNS